MNLIVRPRAYSSCGVTYQTGSLNTAPRVLDECCEMAFDRSLRIIRHLSGCVQAPHLWWGSCVRLEALAPLRAAVEIPISGKQPRPHAVKLNLEVLLRCLDPWP